MALGARKSYIISQFLIETFVITLVGGSAGFIFAMASWVRITGSGHNKRRAST